jgi:hypothetical protein
MVGAAYRPIGLLLPYVFPAGEHLMVGLRAYLDDSGDGDSPDETHLTIGGFLAEHDGWRHFEPRWKALLDDCGLPYLHMKEFGDPQSPIYGHIKSDPAKEMAFMQRVISLIKESARGSMAATVDLNDLHAFNKAHRLQIDPYALAVYGCLFQLRSYHPNDEIEIVVDSFDNSVSRVAKALAYAKSDSQDRLRSDLFIPIPLQKEKTWREISPLQAADLIAWEMRKYRRERAALRPPPEIRSDDEAVNRWVQAWEEQQEKKPRDRMSFQSLRQGMIFRPLHSVVDAHVLEILLTRHPNGWGE